MAAFIKKDNQELLWNTINKSEYFAKHFHPGSHINSTEWFKNIIQQFYYENANAKLSLGDLRELNRNVLKFMLNELKIGLNHSSYKPIPFHPSPPPQEMTQQLPIYNEKKQDSYSYQLELRQREYEQMNEKKLPPKPEFGENVKDEAISNMDELIKKHMEERERELSAFAKPNDTPKINILSTDENTVPIQVEEIIPSKKMVTWKEDTNTIIDEIRTMKNEIDEFRSQIQLLHNKMERLLSNNSLHENRSLQTIEESIR